MLEVRFRILPGEKNLQNEKDGIVGPSEKAHFVTEMVGVEFQSKWSNTPNRDTCA